MSTKTNGVRRPQGGHRPRTIIDLPMTHAIGEAVSETPVPGPALFPAGDRSASARLDHLEGLVSGMHAKLTESRSHIARQAEYIEGLEGRVGELITRVQVLEDGATKSSGKPPRGALEEQDYAVYNFLRPMPGVKFSISSIATNMGVPAESLHKSIARLLSHEMIDREAAPGIDPNEKDRKRVRAWNYFVPAKTMKPYQGEDA